MKRSVPLVALVLIAAACSGSGEPSATLPQVPTSLPMPVGSVEGSTTGCLFSIGGALGAEIVDVEAASPAAGVLEVGDVIVSFGGEPTPTAGAVVAAVQVRQADESVVVEYERGGATAEAELVLAPSPSGGDGAFLGVRIVTLRTEFGGDELPDEPAPTGPLARLAPIDGALYALDGVAGEWSRIAQIAPTEEESYASVGGEVYVLQIVEDGLPVLNGLLSGSALVLDRLEEWIPLRTLAPLGEWVLILARRSEGETVTAAGEAGVLAINPHSGNIVWEWSPELPAEAPADDIPVPVAAFSNPHGDRALIAMVTTTSGSIAHAILDVEGQELTGWPDSQLAFLPSDAIGRGWYGEEALLYRSAQTNELRTFDLITGSSGEPVQVDVSDIDGLWPVGDGRHLLTRTSTSLLLIDAEGEEENLRLARGCQVGTLSDPGWTP